MSLPLLFVPLIFVILTPNTYKCCRSGSKKKVQNIVQQNEQQSSTTAKLSMILVGFNYFICTIIFVAFTAINFVVLIPQFKLFSGEFLSQGTNNELFNPFFILVMFYNYRQ